MFRRLLLCLLALVASCAIAQTTPVSAALTISWTPPTTAGSGTQPVTGVNALTGYDIYVSTTPLTATPATPTATLTTSGGTSSKTTFNALVGQTLYVYVTAVDSSGQSLLSAPATYVVPAQGFAPDSPTQVSITVVITT
jgi:hypothetical protein